MYMIISIYEAKAFEKDLTSNAGKNLNKFGIEINILSLIKDIY